MEAVPYEIREEDVDEVLGAYEATGGGTFDDETRRGARAHVMRNVTDISDIVRSAPESAGEPEMSATKRAMPEAIRPGEGSHPRREMALAAIEDLLIRDGFIDASDDETRVFPVVSDESS